MLAVIIALVAAMVLLGASLFLTVRVEQLESRMADMEVRAGNLGEALRVINRALMELDGKDRERVLGTLTDRVTKEQVEDARKRAGIGIGL